MWKIVEIISLKVQPKLEWNCVGRFHQKLAQLIGIVNWKNTWFYNTDRLYNRQGCVLELHVKPKIL